jgi:hypothetical protein
MPCPSKPFAIRCRRVFMVNSLSGSGASPISGSSSQEQMQQMQQDVLNAVASQLGESASDLQKALASGKSLTDLAKAKGVSADALKTTIAGVVQKDMPNASADQIANVTKRIMGGHHHHHGGSASAAPAAPAAADAASAPGSTVSVVA